MGRETFAISFAAVLVVVALLSAYVGVSLAPVRTVTLVQPATATTNRVYKVTFEQVQYCGEYNILPWGVSIDGLVQVQPRNQSLPLPTNTLSTIVPDKNLTQMAFYLPRGDIQLHTTGWVGIRGAVRSRQWGPQRDCNGQRVRCRGRRGDISQHHMHVNNQRLPKAPLGRSCSAARLGGPDFAEARSDQNPELLREGYKGQKSVFQNSEVGKPGYPGGLISPEMDLRDPQSGDRSKSGRKFKGGISL